MKTGTLIRARPQQPRPPALVGDPGNLDWLYSILGVVAPSAPIPVTERTVNGLTGVSAAVSKVANACAIMMSDADVFAADGLTELDTPNVVSDPCTGYDSFTFWREVFSTGLMRGNFIGIKCDYDPVTAYPRQVVPVPIDAVHAFYEEGFLVYEIGGEHFAPDELVHVKIGLTLPGVPMAIGVVEAHRRNLSGMLSQQGMANTVWQNGAVPSGIVQLDIDLPTQDQASTAKANWSSVLDGQRTVAIIGRRMNYTPVTWSADDAQFLQSRQFSIAESALMFGLRPEDLGSSFGASSGALSYGNRGDDAIQRITDSYLPIMLPAEQAWSRLIPGKSYVMGNVESLLRSTTRERYELHGIAQQTGLETVDESRAAEGKPPKPKPEPVAINPADTGVSGAQPALPTPTEPGDPATAPIPSLMQVPRRPTQGG